jgi:hypothetical protein
MMGEFVLNEVEEKEFFAIKRFICALIPNIPAFHYSILMVK